MSDVAISVDGLSKLYRIGAQQAKYRTLRDTIAGVVMRPITRIRHPGAAVHRVEDLWALRDVSFELPHGQVLGVVGRNGAGKSTLLKILSRITEPTSGRATVNGRVGSLLEVGTGFHPELTGRENIYLNGAILGMTRAEIARKFDEIVEFSEIARFLDTPVKRYSSGMYVRLAFAVAAHFEPEILVVDEVLSVGDAAFQKKCLGKMEHVAGEGRTVLFVSHNMPAIRSLCSHAIQLEAGQVVNTGSATAVVDEYLKIQASIESSVTWPDASGPGDETARLTGVSVLDRGGAPAPVVTTGDPFLIRMEVEIGRLSEALCIGFDLATADGATVLRSYQTDAAYEDWPALHLGRNRLYCEVPPGLLNDGRYLVLPRVSLHRVRWIVSSDAAVAFEVHRDTGESPYALMPRPGTVAPFFRWTADPGTLSFGGR
ncbi:MAG TPA: ABC transporter ATP-binding protein [Thermoleophilia bacterium]|nr:ABC transporter ATP-binding protein [Thermoleophilia bacterium]